jgi:hypothetical protein
VRVQDRLTVRYATLVSRIALTSPVIVIALAVSACGELR